MVFYGDVPHLDKVRFGYIFRVVKHSICHRYTCLYRELEARIEERQRELDGVPF